MGWDSHTVWELPDSNPGWITCYSDLFCVCVWFFCGHC